MTFNIFNSPTKEGIDVGYISSDRGYVQNVTICEANEYAKSNPGTVFIVKNRDFVKYLDINEVNDLDPQDLIPENTTLCAGYEEDIEIDANGGVVVVKKGGVDLEHNPKPCDTSVHFYGGGGVGVHANPIVGSDGGVLAVDVIRGGFGYQYPPLVDIKDTCGRGVGAKAKAYIDEQGVPTFKYYDDLDVEEYKICDDDTPGFGRRYSPEGKDLGPWDPELYRREAEKTPYQRAVDEYNRAIREYEKPWVTSRDINPSLIFWNTSNRSTKEKYDVVHSDWSDFMNSYAISPVPMSNLPGTDFGNESFSLEWDVEFPTDGEYNFRGLYDGALNYGDFYVDNEKIGTFKKSNQNPEKISKIYSSGIHKLAFTLKNNIFKKPADIQPNVSNIVRGTTRTEIIGDSSLNNNQVDISITGLQSPGDRRWASSTRLEFDDNSGNGFDVNASFTITNVAGGTAVFNQSGETIDFEGDSVDVTLKYKWNDNPNTSGKSLETIQIGNTVWVQTNTKKGEEVHTVTLQRTINTRTITTPTTADVSYGADVPASSIEIRSIFNTRDWIDKANRKLWKTPINGGFLGVYGVTPFDPSGIDKGNIVKGKKTLSKKFWMLYKSNSDTGYTRTGELVDIETDSRFRGYHTGKKNYPTIRWNDDGSLRSWNDYSGGPHGYGTRPDGSAVTQAEVQEMRRIWKKGGRDSGPHKRWSGEYFGGSAIVRTDYLSSGGIHGSGTGVVYSFSAGTGSTFMLDKHGNYGSAISKSWGSYKAEQATVDEVAEYEGRSSDPELDAHAGIHRIIWNKITFPISANYKIEVQVDDNVRLKIGDQVDIQKDGFATRGDGRTATGKSTYNVYVEKGSYEVIADLEQIEGGAFGFESGDNSMVLGINIEAEVATEDVLDDTKSWNENPLGLALSIESPLPLPPVQALPAQEGHCPPNPIWHTRLPAKKRWHPVVGFPFWSKFLNQYALSPLPPLTTYGTDGTGTVYRNTWTVDLPYSGEYGLKGAVDNWGRILIDGVPYQRFSNEDISSLPSEGSVNGTLAGPTQKKQPISRIELSEGQHEITVEVENWKNYESPRTFIEKKIFNTKDWQASDASGTKTYADVTFKTTTASAYGNSITIAGIFSEAKVIGDPELNVTNTYKVEKGKVYDVTFTSDSTGTGTDGIQYIGLKSPGDLRYSNSKRLIFDDNSGNGFDTNGSFTIDSVRVVGERGRQSRGPTASRSVSFAKDGRSFIVKGDQPVEVTLTYSWNDNPRTSGKALGSIKYGSTTWTQTNSRSGSETHTIIVGDNKSAFGTSNNSNIKLRNKGDSVVQMEDLPDDISDWDWQDMVCTASEGRFYDFQGNKCKYVIGNDISTTSTRNGVVYKGPKLYHYYHASYGKFIREDGVSPDYPKIGGVGEVVTYEWSNVDFDADGEYEFHFANDAHGSLFLDDVEIIRGNFDTIAGISAIDASNWTIGQRKKIQVTKGKHIISVRPTNINSGAHAGNVDGLFTKLSDDYYKGQQAWDDNGSAFAVNVSRKVETFPEAGSNDIRLGKSWEENPMAISAILIPAPCRQDVDGKGVVTRVEVLDPGTDFPRPTKTIDPPDYEVTLVLDEITVTRCGIGYSPDPGLPDVPPELPPPVGVGTIPPGPGIGTGPRIIVDPPNGAEFEPEFDTYGRLVKVNKIKPGIGFTQFPRISYPNGPGINVQFRPVFSVIRDPIFLDLEADQLIQVTDLVGLKQNGYYKGRPYYGAVFYKDGVKYAGYFETAGEMIRVYDTLQESIDARVTTPPSAIQRQGTDTNSNNPRLNIPDTPENLI